MSQHPSHPAQHLAPHRGGMILAFGILGLVVCFIFGIIAWSMGSSDLKAIDQGRMDPTGRGLTQAGQIIGIVATAINLLSLLAGAFFVIVVLLGAAASAGAAGP